MLKVETLLQNKEIIQSEKGTPQGGILSPLLANIVLNELDMQMILNSFVEIEVLRKRCSN
ncbi:MAG: hypothetical protein ACRC6A_04005 [Fusobacteriaceae bacterium]